MKLVGAALIMVLLGGCEALQSIHYGPPGTSQTHLVVTLVRGTLTDEVWAIRSVVDAAGKRAETRLPENARATPLELPTRYTVVGNQLEGEATVHVEALNRAGLTVGRGRNTAQVEFQQGVQVEIILAPACDTDAECDDGLFCTGVEYCADGTCHNGDKACPRSEVACVSVTCSEIDRRCDRDLRHSLCEPLATDAGLLTRYCDPLTGCAVGQGCEVAGECQDGLDCNGVEQCLVWHCLPGQPQNVGDDNPCTVDACVEGSGIRHFDVADGTPCETPAITGGICVDTTCVVSMCGDGYQDAPTESCDDGANNPNDQCNACSGVAWQPSLLLGLGIHAGLSNRVELSSPHALTFNASGTLFIADRHQLWRRDAITGTVMLLAGDVAPGFAGDGNAAALARFNQVHGLAALGDALLVADTGNHRIRRIAEGKITTLAGFGEPGFSGDNGPAFLARVNAPRGLATDLSGTIYVADTGNHVIRKISGGTITTVAGTGAPGFDGDNTPGLQTRLQSPSGVLVDRAGNLVIADTGNNRVRVLNMVTGMLSTLAGNGMTSGGAVMGLATEMALNAPLGVAQGGQDELLVTSRDHRVWRIDRNGFMSAAVGTGTPGRTGDNGPAADATLNQPSALALSNQGDLAIADTGNQRVRRVDAQRVISTWVGLQGPVYAGYGSSPLTAWIAGPAALALDAQGRIYVAERQGHRIRRILPTGVVETVAGTGENGFDGDNGAATQARLSSPAGVALAADGALLISDTGNHRIRRVDLSTGTISTLAGTGDPGYRSGDENQPASLAQLSAPSGLAVDGAGSIYVADSGSFRVRRIALAGQLITTVAGNGLSVHDGDGAQAVDASVVLVQGVAVAMDGTLYLADEGANRVRRVAPDGVISTFAGTGAPASTGNGMAATLAAVHAPRGVLVDGSDVIVVETGGHQLRRIDVNGVISAHAGTGAADFWGDSEAALNARFNAPEGAALSAQNELLIADTGNGLVRRVGADGKVSTVAGTVHVGDGPFETAKLMNPLALAHIAPGRMLVADGSSGRVRLINTSIQTVTTVAGYPHGVGTNQRASMGSRFIHGAAGVAWDVLRRHAYVTEREGHVIHRITIPDVEVPSAWTIETFAGVQGDGRRVNGTLAAARFLGPAGLAFDATARRLLVTETGGHDVRSIKVDEPSAPDCVVVKANEAGLVGFSGDEGTALSARLAQPNAVAAASDGAIFVADTGNHRIRRIAPDGTLSPLLGTGGLGSAGVGVPARMFTASAPRGLLVDGWGNVIFTSEGSVRVANPVPGVAVLTGNLEERLLHVYGVPQQEFPATSAQCLSGVSAEAAGSPVFVTDACTGFLVRVDQQSITAAP